MTSFSGMVGHQLKSLRIEKKYDTKRSVSGNL